MRPKGSYFTGNSWVSPAPSTNLSINPNRNPRMAFRTHSNSFASKGLLGFPPSGYEISGLILLHRDFHLRRVALFYRAMQLRALLGLFFFMAGVAQAQIQVELKLKRLQYIAYEPVVATLIITNLAGRDVELHDDRGQHWFGFEVSGKEGQPIAPATPDAPEPALKVEAGKTITRKINLTPIYPVHDLGTYHVRANVYFADLNKFFYSQPKVFEVTNARPIWQKTVGVPEGTSGGGSVRTYSLLTNRFADHTSLYVRVENKDSGAVYATYSLGRIITFDEPQEEIDRANQLHVLHCAAPRTWAYSHVGLNGELLKQETFMETKSRPRLHHRADGAIAVSGGMLEAPVPRAERNAAPKLSTRPAEIPKDD
jgi:hypothetical protein